jgi:hypothetical protein
VERIADILSSKHLGAAAMELRGMCGWTATAYARLRNRRSFRASQGTPLTAPVQTPPARSQKHCGQRE